MGRGPSKVMKLSIGSVFLLSPWYCVFACVCVRKPFSRTRRSSRELVRCQVLALIKLSNSFVNGTHRVGPCLEDGARSVLKINGH